MAALIRHFGDRSDSSRTCGLCDFCSPERALAQPFREPTADEEREMRRILRELSKVPSKSTGKLHGDLYPKQQIDRKELDTLLDALCRAGYLTIESATFRAEDGREIAYRKAVITHEGREVDDGESLVGVQLRDAEMANAGRPSRERPATKKPARKAEADEREMQPLTEEQKQFEGALRAWRKEVAAELKQPAFCVFGDRVLRGIVLEGARTEEDLLQVHGLGKAKVERWGKAICDLRRTRVTGASAPSAAPVGVLKSDRIVVAPHQPIAPPAAATIPSAASGGMEHALKVWRMHEAKRQGVTPFTLLIDATVKTIVQAAPLSVVELEQVQGVTLDWASRFGDAVCKVIRQHAVPTLVPHQRAGAVFQ